MKGEVKTQFSELILTTSFPFPHLGGLSRVMLCEALYFAKRNYNVLIISPPGETRLPIFLKHNKIQLIRKSNIQNKGPFRAFMYWLFSALLRAFPIRKLARANQGQILHAHDFYAALACVIAGQSKRTVLHLHSAASKDRFIMYKPLSTLSGSWKFFTLIDYFVDNIIEAFVYNMVRAIICASEYEFRDALKKSINKRKIFILRNGVDTTLFKPKPQLRKKLRHKMNINDDTLVCMYLGRLVPKNGPFLIVKAASLVSSKSSKALFMFVGEGTEKEKIMNYVRNQKITNVIFTGELFAENILPIADFFISHVSSLCYGYGITILEAMASGIPTITGRDPIKEKFFKNGEEIILVPKDNPKEIAKEIVSLQRNEKKRKQLSVNGRRKVERQFSLEAAIKKLECILRSIG